MDIHEDGVKEKLETVFPDEERTREPWLRSAVVRRSSKRILP
jgi:hypothetical protein